MSINLFPFRRGHRKCKSCEGFGLVIYTARNDCKQVGAKYISMTDNCIKHFSGFFFFSKVI